MKPGVESVETLPVAMVRGRSRPRVVLQLGLVVATGLAIGTTFLPLVFVDDACTCGGPEVERFTLASGPTLVPLGAALLVALARAVATRPLSHGWSLVAAVVRGAVVLECAGAILVAAACRDSHAQDLVMLCHAGLLVAMVLVAIAQRRLGAAVATVTGPRVTP